MDLLRPSSNPNPRASRLLRSIVLAVVATIVAVTANASPALADHGVNMDPNTECQLLFGDPGYIGYKIDVVSEASLDGTYDDPNSDFSVTISNTNTTLHTFDYSANIPVNVHVKGGSDPIGNNYWPPAPYTTPQSSGTGLHAPVNPNNGEFYGLSHIVFCWIPPDTTLSIEKTPDSQNISAGEDVVFTITVTNTGNEIAHDTTLTDTLPSGTSGAWVEDPDNPDCTITGNLLDCDFGDLAPSASRTVTVKAPTDYDNCAAYDNTATAVAVSAPQVQDDGQVTCQTPDLTVEKTPDSQTINAGEDVVFTITTTNNGPGTAKSVGLADTLPGGTAGAWTIDSQPAGDPCSITGSTLTCLFGDMASGISKTVTVKAPTDYDNCAVYDNTAQADATNTPSTSDDGQVTCQTPDLTVEKTPDSQTINAGEDVVFTITTTNNGPGTAKSVQFLDGLPTGTAGPWTITSQPGGDPCTITGNDLTCVYGDLNAGSSRTVTVKAPTSYDECAVYDNSVTVTSGNHPNEGDSGQVTCQTPGLVISKTPDSQVVNAGDEVAFTITVTNNGPGTAYGVTMSDPLPGPVAGNWVIDPADQACSIANSKLACAFGDLADGESRTVTVKAQTDYDNCAVYDNTASAVGQNVPEVTDDGQITCQKPALVVTKEGNGTITAGQDVRFTIKVKNNGPGVAKGVTLSDTLPNNTAGAWKIVSQPTGDPCTLSGRNLSCSFGDMASGAQRAVTVKAPTSYDKCAVYDNRAVAVPTNGVSADDRDKVTCRRPEAVLLLKKTADHKKARPGDRVAYKIWVRNSEPESVAKDLKVCDQIPPKMTVVETGGGSFEDGRLCWKIAELPYSKSWTTFRYVTRVDDDAVAGTKLRNVVTLGKKKASHVVVVQRPQGVKGAGAGGNTPVTG
jgi:uncharacterized repeat protein (TIGR01451 family)